MLFVSKHIPGNCNKFLIVSYTHIKDDQARRALFCSPTMSLSELENEMSSELRRRVNYNYSLTHQEVQDLVNRAIEDEATVQKFSIKPYSDGKLGFLASHLRLTVEVKTRSGRDVLSFFVKVVPHDAPEQAEYMLDRCVFLKERIFYRDIVPQLYHGYENEPLTANCYLVKENLLVFEDLSLKGYSMRDKLFNKELIVSGLTSIARLHACSLLAEARLGKSLKKLYPVAFVENAFIEIGKTRTRFEVAVNAIVAIAEYLGLNASMVPQACEYVYPSLETSSTKRNVVSHGDLWANNMLFSNTVPPKCLLIDFQLLRYLPLAHDVVQFLYLCADRDFRLDQESAMLKHYYSVLCETLNSAKLSPVEVPPWSELIEGMEEQRLPAIITTAIYFQNTLMDEKTSAEILDNSDKYQDFEFKNKNEFVLNLMKTDPVYNKRMSEIVTELTEFSFRLDKIPRPN